MDKTIKANKVSEPKPKEKPEQHQCTDGFIEPSDPSMREEAWILYHSHSHLTHKAKL